MNYTDFNLNNRMQSSRTAQKSQKDINFDDIQISGSLRDSLGVGNSVVLDGSESRIKMFGKDRLRSSFGKSGMNENSPFGLMLKDPRNVKIIEADGTIKEVDPSQTFSNIIVTGSITLLGTVDGIDLSAWINQALLTNSAVTHSSIRAAHKSSDGTDGLANATVANPTSITVKDGLITAIS